MLLMLIQVAGAVVSQEPDCTRYIEWLCDKRAEPEEGA
ncbi:hypothetical protein AA0111_g1653 [Alternaria arborescens]|nr:hypothetical protein AA0111_g1653 [Alternaria arborescens]RYO39402.1 hypothetical protein AA0111_g1653 [Alternaria arborescens]